MINEEGLRDWFGKSKSKDGKKGWVNVVTGDSCASDKPGEGVPKCVSSAKRASMSKKERKAAAAAKRREDPGQQQKSGAAKPTMVKTDRKVRKEDMDINEAKDKKGKGSGSKDACYHKVKSRYSVWPSAYASGALVKCRKVGAANWGNSSKKEEFEGFYDLPAFTESQIAALKYAGYEVEVLDEKCWKGYEKKGMKTMFGKRYPNCVKKEEVENVDEACWDTHEQRGMKKKGGKMVPNCVPKGSVKKEEVTGGILIQDKDDFTPREIESVDIIKPEPIKGGQLQEVVRTKPQSGNMYQVIFGWRGKMMMVKLFFPDSKVPNRQQVAAALHKMYPDSQLRSYSISVVDYDDPYINVGVDEETILEKEDERYCRLCEKKETRSKCAYGGSMWDKYSVKNVSDDERSSAASESGITESDDYNDEVKDRMKSDKKRRRTLMRNVMKSARDKQKQNLPANQKEEVEIEEGKGMEGMTQKGGHKRSTESGAGLTQKGVEKYRRQNPGSKLKTAVTTPPSKLKPGAKAAKRRKSFCARSRGWTGERGKAARRRWNC